MPSVPEFIPNLVGNATVPRGAKSYAVVHPSTKREVHRVHASTQADIVKAIEACQNAFPAWSKSSLESRREILFRTVALLKDPSSGWAASMKAANIKETEISDFFAQVQVEAPIDMITELACCAREALETKHVNLQDDKQALITKEPYGVCLAIPAWNAVHALTSRAIIVPLIAGNTVVLKTSETTPYSQYLWAELLYAAGLPDGVLSVVHVAPDDAPSLMEALIKDRRIRHVNFTGSTRVGSILAGLAGKYLKPTVMELGGKAPVLVLPDADIELAANNIIFGTFLNSGQICMSTERIIVPQTQFQPLCESLQRQWQAQSQDVTGKIKGLFTSASAQRVAGLLRESLSTGTTAIIGKTEVASGRDNGVHPAIVGPISAKMRIYSEETFAPVAGVIVVPDQGRYEAEVIKEMIRAANDSEYGLTASVWSKDLNKALKVAGQIESGAVHINSMTVADPPNLPHGGWKQSGWGRFNGVEGIRWFTQTRTVEFSTGHAAPLHLLI